MLIENPSVQAQEVQPHTEKLVRQDKSASDSESDASLALTSQDSKKRKRNIRISCDLCKQRKVRCDRAEPSCGWCARNSRLCIYSERKKPGFRLAQVQELEDKVNRLEAVTFSLGRRLEDHITEHGAFHNQQLQPRQPASLGLTRTSPYPESHVHRNPTVDSPRMLPKELLGQGHFTRASNPTSITSAIVTESPMVVDEGHRLNFSHSYALGTPTIPETSVSPGSDPLPPHDLAFSLVDLFFKHVNPWSPILDRKSTFDKIFRETSSSNNEGKVLLHAIIATTLRFSRDPRLTPPLRKQYYDASRTQILLQVISNPSVYALQALLLLAIDVAGTANYSEALNLVALLARNILHLKLACEKVNYLEAPEYPALSGVHAFSLSKPSSWIEDEGRRRLAWMAYILDRYLTVLDCSSFTLPDRSMDRRLPTTYDLFSRNVPVKTRWPRSTDPLPSTSQDSNLGSFSYHCEVLTILSRVHDFLQSPIDVSSADEFASWRASYQSLDSELNTWLHSLPGEYGKISQLCHSDPGSKISNWIMLHAAFVTTVIRLHSAAAYPAISASNAALSQFKPSYNAMQRCLGAVESLREIAQDTIKNSMLDLLGPLFAFSLWTSARLLLVHAATMDCEVDPQIHFFIATLQIIGTYWQIASTYAETLTRVVSEGQQNAHSFARNSISNSNTVHSFKEMRKAAFELHSLSNERQRADVDLPRTHMPRPNELEYLDVFNYFKYPIIVADTPGRSGSISHVQSMGDSNLEPGTKSLEFAMPRKESDWLTFQPPRE